MGYNYIHGEKFVSVANNNNIFYCNTHDVNYFLKNNTIKTQFVLVSHNSDGKITDRPNTFDADVTLIPDKLIKWYGQNVNIKHPKIESLPIGLENTCWFPHINKPLNIKNKLNESKNIRNLVYMNFNINTNPVIRGELFNVLKGNKFVTVDMCSNGVDFDKYIDNLYNHKFILCPEGNGTDTHRTWETLYLNSIPIEKRNLNNIYYQDLPICFVDEWSDITVDFLNAEYIRITNSKWNTEKLSFNYWVNKINKSVLANS